MPNRTIFDLKSDTNSDWSDRNQQCLLTTVLYSFSVNKIDVLCNKNGANPFRQLAASSTT